MPLFSFLPQERVALVLSGGGARGAFQVGVLSAWKDILEQGGQFPIIVGVSAGAINAACLMQHAPNFAIGVDALEKLWCSLSIDQVYRVDVRGFFNKLLGWSHDLLLSQVSGKRFERSLLDNRPLEEFLHKSLQFDLLANKRQELPDYALALSAYNYDEKVNVTFFQTGSPAMHLPWMRSRRRGVVCDAIGLEHVMASAAIPMLFPSVQIGRQHFADGSIHNMTPLSPAIRLGADRIIVINLRGPISTAATAPRPPNVSDIAGMVLDSLFFDGIETDIEFLRHLNRLSRTEEGKNSHRDLRDIELLHITPQISFSEVAHNYVKRLPRAMRYLLAGLGRSQKRSGFLSYLMFDPDFIREMMKLGEQEGRKHRAQVEEWLLGPR